jgi:hypothetical protein
MGMSHFNLETLISPNNPVLHPGYMRKLQRSRGRFIIHANLINNLKALKTAAKHYNLFIYLMHIFRSMNGC